MGRWEKFNKNWYFLKYGNCCYAKTNDPYRKIKKRYDPNSHLGTVKFTRYEI